MARSARPFLLLALSALAALALATPAAAAKRKVPYGFFGTTLSTVFGEQRVVPDALLDEQMGVMAANGVESLRVVIDWRSLEPARGAYRWTVVDRLVAASARRGIEFLPNVSASPRWASERPRDAREYWRSPPKSPVAYGRLMRQMVLRYGPRGSFWAQNPTVPRTPIRKWQIWNEPTAPWFWNRPRFAPSYTKLLRASARAIRRVDRRAKVIVGGLVAPRPDYAPWDAIRDLYRSGAKRWFDAVSVHPFTNAPSVRTSVRQTVEIVRRVRAQMRRRGDRRKPIMVTELTWPAAVGKVPAGSQLRLSTTEQGQIARLKSAYRRFAAQRRRLNVTQVDWFTWASQYDANAVSSVVQFRFAGLTRFANGVFTPMPVLSAFADTAAAFQGCRKSANARVCR
jgi:hypothetical protein